MPARNSRKQPQGTILVTLPQRLLFHRIRHLTINEIESTRSPAKESLVTKKKTTRYLTVSLLIVISVCVLVFAALGGVYRSRSEAAIQEVSHLYMTTINQRLSAHFETAVDYCLSQLESVVAEVNPESVTTFAETDREVTSSALRWGFAGASLMGEDSLIETIFGDPLILLYPDQVYSTLEQGRTRIGIGRISGRPGQVEACAIPARYPMSDGTRSIALVGVLADDFLPNILTLDAPDSIVSSFIIRPDGSYVLREDTYGQSYYADLLVDVPEDDEARDEQFVAEMQSVMETGEDFTGTYSRGDVEVHVLATPLAYSNWYMLTEMPDGALTQAVGDLGTDAVTLVIIACAVVLLCLGFVFFGYYRLTRAHIQEIEVARAEADRANKAKSEFFSNMSHDIRTPMNAIVGMTSIAQSRLGNKEAVANALRKISLSSKQLLGLINDVLDMSRIESGNLQLRMDSMSLREFMDSVVSIIQPQMAAKRQKFSVYVDNITVENVYCDGVRLNQVLLNLLANAVKYTPEGGSVTLAMYETPSEIGNDYITVNVDVSDDGIGMSPEFQEKIFQSFAREDSAVVRHTEGVGLGMAITRHIVDAMKGTIELESAPGKGTQFHLALDLEKAQEREPQEQLPPMRVLVIDDDAQSGESACSMLESLGARADSAMDGDTGIKQLVSAAEANEPYDAVIVDWKLPYMNGVQTAQRIREEVSENMPILLMSAYEWADVEDDAVAAGIDGFLAKPLFRSTLHNGLLSAVGSAPKKKERKEQDFSGKRLLVAEDNEINWEIMETLLTEYGFSVDHASDGEEVVAKFAMSPNGYYDAILMDVHMPVQDGLQATQQIRAMRKQRPDAQLPIIAMTADAFADDIQRSMDYGMDAHVSKPVDVDELLKKLTRFLKRT